MANKKNVYPITRSEQIFLACPNCEADTQPAKPPVHVEGDQVIYHYQCPQCGATCTSLQSYPHVRNTFDRTQRVVEDEESTT